MIVEFQKIFTVLHLSLSDKLDSLVGFFGLNLIPTGSKDPYALRRYTIGLSKINY